MSIFQIKLSELEGQPISCEITANPNGNEIAFADFDPSNPEHIKVEVQNDEFNPAAELVTIEVNSEADYIEVRQETTKCLNIQQFKQNGERALHLLDGVGIEIEVQ